MNLFKESVKLLIINIKELIKIKQKLVRVMFLQKLQMLNK
jgi:hypothetical protein